MMLLPTLASALSYTLMIFFILISLLMLGVILIQRPKGGGLAGAFGGAGGSAEAAFGSRTGDVLTWFTVTLFVLFIGIAIGLNLLIHPPTSTPPELDTPAPLQTSVPTEPSPIAPPAPPAPAATESPTTDSPMPVEPAPVEAAP